MSQKIHVGDVIEYQPRVGRPRIVEVTKIYVRGFDAVHVGNRYIKSFGYFHQVIRVHRTADHEDVNHKTKTGARVTRSWRGSASAGTPRSGSARPRTRRCTRRACSSATTWTPLGMWHRREGVICLHS